MQKCNRLEVTVDDLGTGGRNVWHGLLLGMRRKKMKKKHSHKHPGVEDVGDEDDEEEDEDHDGDDGGGDMMVTGMMIVF